MAEVRHSRGVSPPPKPSHRAIRRAFGPEAVTLLEQQQRTIDFIAASCVLMEKDVLPPVQSFQRFQGLGVLGRLKWLLWGVFP